MARYLSEGRASRLTRQNQLPPVDVARWVSSRKAKVVAAVLAGKIGVDAVARRYAIGRDELQQWIAAFADEGESGLRSLPKKRGRTANIQHRFEIAPERGAWMVVDLAMQRPAIAEETALNGLPLNQALALARALNLLHRELWRAVRSQPCPQQRGLQARRQS
jgi:transposase-like protein